MNVHQFDRLTRALGARTSRRGVLGGTAALALGGSALASPLDAVNRIDAVFAATTATEGSAAALVAKLRTQPFAPASVDALTAELARSGIGVYANEASPQPLVPITGAASPLRLLAWQAHNLALEISAENGRAGAELDALVPDQSSAGVPPPSYLLAGYVGAAATAGGDLARALLAGQDLYAPAKLRFPALIPLLFASDLAREARHAQSPLVLLSAHPGAPAHPPNGAAGICSSIQGFVDGVINAVFGALESEAAAAVGSLGLLGSIWGWIKAGLDKLKEIAKWVARELTEPVLRIIRSVAGVLAIAGQVVSALQPWTVRMAANPAATRFGIGAEAISGSVTASVDLGLIDDWPSTLVDCANQADVTLPPFRPIGDPIVWTTTQAPMPLMVAGDEPTVLDANVQATFVYVTNDETEEDAKGDPHDGALKVMARVARPEIEKLKDAFVAALFAQLPDLIAKIVQPMLGPQIKGLMGQLTGLLASEGVATVPVTYHTPKPKTPTPPAGQAVGVTLESGTSAGWVFKLTAHACAGAHGKWSGTIALHDPAHQTFPIAWSFPNGGTKATASVGPFSVTASGETVTGVFHFTITLIADHAGTPNALVFDLSEDIIGSSAATFPMNGIFSNLGAPIPLTHKVGAVCP